MLQISCETCFLTRISWERRSQRSQDSAALGEASLPGGFAVGALPYSRGVSKVFPRAVTTAVILPLGGAVGAFLSHGIFIGVTLLLWDCRRNFLPQQDYCRECPRRRGPLFESCPLTSCRALAFFFGLPDVLLRSSFVSPFFPDFAFVFPLWLCSLS